MERMVNMKNDEIVYALRRAILREYKRYLGAPLRADELPAVSVEILICRSEESEVLDQVKELIGMGYIAPCEGFGGRYLKITEKGLQQLSPEYKRDPFIWGRGAL